MPSTQSTSLIGALKKLNTLFSRRDKIGFALLLLGMLVGAALETFSIGAIPAFISMAMAPERVLAFEPTRPLIDFLDISSSRDILLWGSVSLIAVFLFKTLYLCFQHWLQIRYMQNVRFRLVRRMFTAYMRAPYVFHLQRNSAELLRNTMPEVTEIIMKVLEPLLMFLMQGLMMLAILSLLLISQPLMALVAACFIGIAGAGYQWWVKGKLVTYSREAQKHRTLTFKAINEGLGVIKEIQVLHREENFIAALNRSLWQTIKATRYMETTRKITSPYIEFTAVAGLLSIAIFLILTGGQPATIAPTLALFTAGLIRLRINVGQMVSAANRLRFGLVSINPVYDDLMLLEKKTADGPRLRGSGDPRRLPLKKELRLEGVWYRYPGSDDHALKDINLVLPRGQSIAFVGPTGSGKTTLVDVILGLLTPEKGRISVDGTDLRTDMAGWQGNIGYIPQFIFLIDDSIRRNVALGLPDDRIDERLLQQAIKAAQLEDFTADLSQGLDTVIGERGVRLSGGQRQRIGIARALYHNPEVLIMDEATSALDSSTERAVVDSVYRLKGDRTIIMIAHRLTTVQNCDQLYFLKNGAIHSHGTYADLFDNNVDFRAMAQTG